MLVASQNGGFFGTYAKTHTCIYIYIYIDMYICIYTRLDVQNSHVKDCKSSLVIARQTFGEV